MTAPHFEPHQLPQPANHNEGKTTAAWVTSAGVVAGAITAGVGFMVPQAAVIWVGVAIVVVALGAGAALRALGHGQPLS